MRYLIVLSVTYFLVSNFKLQAQAVQDVVYLTNQQFHQGIVIEQKPGEYIRLLRLPERDTLQFGMEEIDRIVKIVPPAAMATPANTDKSPEPERRFNRNKNIMMLHGHIGGGKFPFAGLGFSIGHNFHDRWQIGMSVHYLYQTSFRTFPTHMILPLTVEARYKFSQSPKGRFATFFALSSGYKFSIEDRQYDSGLNLNVLVKGGLYFNPSIAFRVNIFPNTGLMLDVGYQLTTGKIVIEDSGVLLDNRTWHNFAARGSLFF